MGFGTHDMFLKPKLHYFRKAISKWRNMDATKETNTLIHLKEIVDEIEKLVELKMLVEEEVTIRRERETERERVG